MNTSQKNMQLMPSLSLSRSAVLALAARGMTVATAESCTGGWIAASLTDIPGCSAVLDGCAVTYANRIKEQLCGVSPDTLRQFGAVSPQTAQQMAQGIRKTMASSVGLASTGIAGPGGGSTEKPVGLVYIACASENRCLFRKLLLHADASIARRAEETPEQAARRSIRMQATDAALELLLTFVQNEPERKEKL